MSPKINKNKRYILVDTNIVSSLSNKNLGEKILAILTEVAGYGFGIAISDLTYFELLDGATMEREDEMMKALNGFTRFQVRKNILVAAAHLGSLYNDEKLSSNQIGPGDKIIASTALLHNCIIFTLNGRDFPPPFFKELARRMLDYQNKEWPVCVPSYFQEPQFEYIGQCHEKKVQIFLDQQKSRAKLKKGD